MNLPGPQFSKVRINPGHPGVVTTYTSYHPGDQEYCEVSIVLTVVLLWLVESSVTMVAMAFKQPQQHSHLCARGSLVHLPTQMFASWKHLPTKKHPMNPEMANFVIDFSSSWQLLRMPGFGWTSSQVKECANLHQEVHPRKYPSEPTF